MTLALCADLEKTFVTHYKNGLGLVQHAVLANQIACARPVRHRRIQRFQESTAPKNAGPVNKLLAPQ